MPRGNRCVSPYKSVQTLRRLSAPARSRVCTGAWPAAAVSGWIVILAEDNNEKISLLILFKYLKDLEKKYYDDFTYNAISIKTTSEIFSSTPIPLASCSARWKLWIKEISNLSTSKVYPNSNNKRKISCFVQWNQLTDQSWKKCYSWKIVLQCNPDQYYFM